MAIHESEKETDVRTPSNLALGAILWLAVALPVTGPSIAHADSSSPIMPASGALIATVQFPLSFRVAGGNTIVDYVNFGYITGTFAGTYVEYGMLVLHADGSESLHSSITLVGSALPCGTGTIPFRVAAQGAAGSLAGQATTVDQSSDTATVHADLTFVQATPVSPANYTGTYHC